MKKLSIFQKFILLFNYGVAFLLLLSFFAKNLPAEKYTIFAVLSLILPLVVVLNIVLMLYWLLKRKRFFWLSAVLLVISYVVLLPIYKFGEPSVKAGKGDFTVMTFNTRNFNKFKSIDKNNVDSLIIDFVNKEDADIICFQEFYHAMKRSDKLSQYTYQFVDFVYGENTGRVIQAVYSKYPILKVEPIEFPKSANSAIYADILIKKDTLRIYNLHLQSFKISPEVNTFKNQNSKRLFGRLKKVIKLQKDQIDIIKEHHTKTNHKTIFVGDFNNTQFSNIYNTLKGDFQDSFLEAGQGFGRTYDLNGLPMRIDYILTDDSFEILEHQNYDVKLSDHYPIKATLQIK